MSQRILNHVTSPFSWSFLHYSQVSPRAFEWPRHLANVTLNALTWMSLQGGRFLKQQWPLAVFTPKEAMGNHSYLKEQFIFFYCSQNDKLNACRILSKVRNMLQHFMLSKHSPINRLLRELFFHRCLNNVTFRHRRAMAVCVAQWILSDVVARHTCAHSWSFVDLIFYKSLYS